MSHRLDRPIWKSLSGHQKRFAFEANGIRRHDAAYAPFAASAGGTAASVTGLAELVPHGTQIALELADVIEPPPGLALLHAALIVQMVAESIKGPKD
jgi:hypothetical protein